MSDDPKITSLGELRAKQEGNAALWTPRDALVNALRDMDEGRVAPTALVVAMVMPRRTGTQDSRYYVSAPSLAMALGTMRLAEAHILKDGMGQ